MSGCRSEVKISVSRKWDKSHHIYYKSTKEQLWQEENSSNIWEYDDNHDMKLARNFITINTA